MPCDSTPYRFLLVTSRHLRCPICCSSSTPSQQLPQGLCICWLLSLEYTSPETHRLAPLLHHPLPEKLFPDLCSSTSFYIPYLLFFCFKSLCVIMSYIDISYTDSPSKKENSISIEILSSLSCNIISMPRMVPGAERALKKYLWN